MNFSRLDALCQEAEREAPRKAPNGAKRPTTESNAAAPSLDDFMRMFDEEDARSSGRPVGTDIVSNSQEEASAKAAALPAGLMEDEDGDLAHVFFEEFPDGLLEVRPGSLQPLDAPSEATKPLVPSAPVVPKPDRAKRGRGGFSAAMARPSAEEHGTLEPSALRQKEGDEKLAHDMDVLEGKEHSQKYKKAESTMPSMEELLGKLEAEEGTHLAERSKNELPKKTDKAPGDVAQDAVKAEAGIFSNFGQRRFDAIEAATVESKRRKEAEAELFGRLASERQRAEKGQGETEERSDLQERLARLKAQQAADWDQDEKASVAAQASQAKLEKERKQAKERRKRAGNNRTCEETPVAQACVEEEEGREADEEARRLEEEQKEQERRRVEEEARIEAERQEAERARLEQERKEEEERKKAEEARRLEEEQKEQERRRVEEEARIEAERQEAERARLEQERKEEERRKAEEEEEARRLEEEQKEQERRRVEEEARIEAERQEAERARLEQERKEEERREAEEVARRLEEQQKEQADAALSVEVEPPQEVAQGQPGRRRRAGFSAMVMQTAPGEARKSSQAVEAELQGAELLSDPARPPEEAVDANQEIPSVEALLQMLAEEDSPQESAPTVTASAVEDPSERQVAAELAASSVASEKAVQEPRPSGRRRKGFSTALQALPKEEVQEPTDAVPSMEALLAMLDAQ